MIDDDDNDDAVVDADHDAAPRGFDCDYDLAVTGYLMWFSNKIPSHYEVFVAQDFSALSAHGAGKFPRSYPCNLELGDQSCAAITLGAFVLN